MGGFGAAWAGLRDLSHFATSPYFGNFILSLFAFAFLVSGSAKAGTPTSNAVAAAHFGLPDLIVRASRRGLPGAELLTACLLAFPPTRLIGGCLATVALLIFTGLHASALLRGVRFSCNCFGGITGEEMAGSPLPMIGVAVAAALGVLALVGYGSIAGNEFVLLGLCASAACAALLLVRTVRQSQKASASLNRLLLGESS